jgi:hypothetical protein
MNQALPSKIVSMTPREIGLQMAALREQFGLSPQEVSERLHIRTRYISAMEEGRYDLMPGKVYARGYVHTYAEFLGLDADQVVSQCFANEAPPAAPVPPSTRQMPTARLSNSHWRSYTMLVVGALGALLLITQVGGIVAETPTEEPTVAPVPDAMLASVRNLVMPTASNYDCLTMDDVLACFNANSVTRALIGLSNTEHLRYGGDIDVSDMAVPLPEEPAEAAEEPASSDAANE